MNGTYLRQITSRLRLPVIPAQAGIQGTKPPTVQLDPGLRRDDGGFGLSKCHSGQKLHFYTLKILIVNTIWMLQGLSILHKSGLQL